MHPFKGIPISTLRYLFSCFFACSVELLCAFSRSIVISAAALCWSVVGPLVCGIGGSRAIAEAVAEVAAVAPRERGFPFDPAAEGHLLSATALTFGLVARSDPRLAMKSTPLCAFVNPS